MAKTTSIACLIVGMFASTAVCSSKWDWTITPVGFTIALAGVVGTVIGFLPSYGGAAQWNQTCGTDKTVCIDSCTDGCLNMRELQCETQCPLGGKYRWCMRSIDSYHFSNDTSDCPHNGCRGGSQCVKAGEEIVPWNLRYPDKVYVGTKWGIPIVVVSALSIFGGICIAIQGSP